MSHLADWSRFEDAAEPLTTTFQRSLALKSFPAFLGLDAEQLALLARHTRERSFRAGEVMMEPGVEAQGFFLVIEGRVQMFTRGVPTKVMGDRETVGGLAMLTRDPDGAHAVALTDVLALAIDNDDMEDVFEDSFPILVGVLTAVAGTLRNAQIGRGALGAGAGPARTLPALGGDPGLVDRMLFLRGAGGFGTPRVEALAELAATAEVCRFGAGATLWASGEPADDWLLMIEGQVRCESGTKTFMVKEPGHVLGALDALAIAPRWYGATAATPVAALRIRRADLFDALEDHAEMAFQLIRTLAQGIVQLDRDAASGQDP